ncbi:hypothetical protein [Bernardetia sp.]|uniref:hypothetical protein n=1 Tax=Bernardetia sp. TaxID=1937974 RepID=UPI0025BA18B8|nr:hypothetical protein [Bernardetia sp.]
MKTTLFTTFLFLCLSFCSFASESISEVLPAKTQSSHIVKTKNLKSANINKKQKKLNFKERIALKLINKKIKKAQKKQAKAKKIKKNKVTNIIGGVLFSVLLILIGIIGGIIALAMGEVLLGILLLLTGIIVVPILLVIALIG